MGYTPHKGPNQLPGISGPVEQKESRVFQLDLAHASYDGVRIDKDTNDVANVGEEHKLRPGLVLTQVIAGDNVGKYVPLDHADAPANSDIHDVVILAEWVDLKDKTGTRQNCQAKVLTHGTVQHSQLLWNGADSMRRSWARDASLIRYVIRDYTELTDPD